MQLLVCHCIGMHMPNLRSKRAARHVPEIKKNNTKSDGTRQQLHVLPMLRAAPEHQHAGLTNLTIFQARHFSHVSGGKEQHLWQLMSDISPGPLTTWQSTRKAQAPRPQSACLVSQGLQQNQLPVI